MHGSELVHNGRIYLEGEVLSDEWASWLETGFSARMVREALAQFSGDVPIVINSYGGHVVEGEAIRAAFESHSGRVIVEVAGAAMSAASLLIMAADEIRMTAGSILMIHDPSRCVCGTSDDLRREADALDTMADVYAGVYAARAEMSTEDVRAIMRAETFYGPSEAVDAGFADAVITMTSASEPEDDAIAPDVAAARAAFAESQSRLRMCADRADAETRASAQSAGPAGNHQANMAQSTEVMSMPDPVPAATTTAIETPTPVATVEPAPQPTMTGPSPDQIRAEERTRITTIRDRAAPFLAAGRLTEADLDAAISDGLSVADASDRFMTQMAASEPAARAPSSNIEITRDEGETQIEGMIGALMRQTDGPAEQFRGMRIRGLAMHLGGGRGGYSEMDRIRAGMRSTTIMAGAHGVSDFAYITTEVMNRTLMNEYERRAGLWQLVCGDPVSASDFRELHMARFGGDFQLKPVSENGEYQHAVLADEAEGLKVERRGRAIRLTFEAVVNDDMGAFNRIPREFAMAARIMENSMVWALFRSNAALKSDGVALFNAAHGNLGSGGAASVISVDAVGAGRKAMWQQRAFGTKDSDDFLQISPDRLLVPPALEVAAGKFVLDTVPAKDDDANPFKSTLTPSVVPNLSAAAGQGGSDTAWYLIASDLPPIAHAYLEGYTAPTVTTVEGMNPDIVAMDARHIFGAAPVEHRGAYKNNGA